MVMEWLYVVAPAIVLLMFIFLAIAIFLIILWIVMIIDCLGRQMNRSNRIAWIIVLIFIPVIGAILYYFLVYRKHKIKKENIENSGNNVRNSPKFSKGQFFKTSNTYKRIVHKGKK